jgi:hypothetical protein
MFKENGPQGPLNILYLIGKPFFKYLRFLHSVTTSKQLLSIMISPTLALINEMILKIKASDIIRSKSEENQAMNIAEITLIIKTLMVHPNV